MIWGQWRHYARVLTWNLNCEAGSHWQKSSLIKCFVFPIIRQQSTTGLLCCIPVPPWQLKFPQEIALTPTDDELGKYLEMSTIQDNAHISTSGQRTCLWWDEMEWKLFLTIIMTGQEFVQLDAHPSNYWSGQYLSSAWAQLKFLIYSKLNCISPHWRYW